MPLWPTRRPLFRICISSPLLHTHTPVTVSPLSAGVNLRSKGDSFGQQYISPGDAVKLRGADVIIVGRGVTQAENVAEAAEQYKNAGYNAYEMVRSQMTSNR